MAIQGNLYVCQLDEAHKSIKWMILGDTQSRIDVVGSEWVTYEEMTEVPAFKRAVQIMQENGMSCFGPEPIAMPHLLGGKGFHICFLHPRLQGLGASEIPRMMQSIPTG